MRSRSVIWLQTLVVPRASATQGWRDPLRCLATISSAAHYKITTQISNRLTVNQQLQYADYKPGSETQVRIYMVRQPLGKWTKALLQQTFTTMLCEMVHCVSLLFKCRHLKCSKFSSQAKADGISGHGPAWRKVAQAVVRQATWKLTPVYGTWNLDADDRGPSSWREIEQIVDKVINHVIT